MTVIHNEPLKKHSTFKIGGEASVAYFPDSIDEFKLVLRDLRSRGERYMIVGNGSNILFDSRGFDGSVIFTKKMNKTEYVNGEYKTYVTCECGKLLSELSCEVGRRHSLAGLEFAYGIPATVGGAVFMNAGAYGGEMSDVVYSTRVYDVKNDREITIFGDEHRFAYRHSIFEDDRDLCVLSVTFVLLDGVSSEICAKMDENMNSRREKQPIELPSAGSTFKRPTGYFAAKLIDDCGLKGYSVGGASVSLKHAGFIINNGNADSDDVLALIDDIKKCVYDRFGIMLTQEVIYVPKTDIV